MSTEISMTWPQYLRAECSFRGQVIKLGRGIQTEILLYLLITRRLISKQELLEFIYPDPDFEPDYAAENIKKNMCLLRRRFPCKVIENRYYYGYTLAATAAPTPHSTEQPQPDQTVKDCRSPAPSGQSSELSA